MVKKQFRGEYLAPKVKVVEMQARQMLAESNYYSPSSAKDDTSHGTEQYDNGNTSSWF